MLKEAHLIMHMSRNDPTCDKLGLHFLICLAETIQNALQQTMTRKRSSRKTSLIFFSCLRRRSMRL